MEAPPINRIAKSKLITIDPGKFYPAKVYSFDLKDYLFKELMLREKDFRASMDEFDWSQLEGQVVLVHCTSDAIIPMWAYMLITSKAAEFADRIYACDKSAAISQYIIDKIQEQYPADQIEKGKFVVKGCSDFEIDPEVYSSITNYLVKNGARSVMFGEPCSTVPIYKFRKPQ